MYIYIYIFTYLFIYIYICIYICTYLFIQINRAGNSRFALPYRNQFQINYKSF